MTDYYAKKLAGNRLENCYELAPPRVRQYLEAEIQHVQGRVRPTDTVLELGCGYGRVATRVAEFAHRVVGVDTAEESLKMARELAGSNSRCDFLNMNALNLRFGLGEFDLVVCIQNGICAFRVNQEALVREALRVTRGGGKFLLSSYADRFWPHRLAWFRAQAAAGLVGEIDEVKSGDGVIACKDGFRSGRITPRGFSKLCAQVGCNPAIIEVDESSVFCEITKNTPSEYLHMVR